jgi:agmatine deiminase
VLGIEKVIWLPGIAGQDITDGHTDFYARFCAPGGGGRFRKRFIVA